MASTSSDASLSLNTILHMLTIKLSSTNYLLWKIQIIALLKYHKLFDYVYGATVIPPAIVNVEDKPTPNLAHSLWIESDQ